MFGISKLLKLFHSNKVCQPKKVESVEIFEQYFIAKYASFEVCMYYKEIIRISAMFIPDQYLPEARWTIQTKKQNVDIYNNTHNLDKLLFNEFKIHLPNYNSEEVYKQLLEVITSTYGVFTVWESEETEEFFRDFKPKVI